MYQYSAVSLLDIFLHAREPECTSRFPFVSSLLLIGGWFAVRGRFGRGGCCLSGLCRQEPFYSSFCQTVSFLEPAGNVCYEEVLGRASPAARSLEVEDTEVEVDGAWTYGAVAFVSLLKCDSPPTGCVSFMLKEQVFGPLLQKSPALFQTLPVEFGEEPEQSGRRKVQQNPSFAPKDARL